MIRFTETTFPDTFTYDAIGQVFTHTDGKGQTTRLLRTARGLPSSRQDAKGQRIRYEYDKAIRLTVLVNKNNAAYQFAYDASDRLIEEKRIDNLTRRLSYNIGGHLTRVDEIGYGDRAERPQRHTEFERDPIGRLLAKPIWGLGEVETLAVNEVDLLVPPLVPPLHRRMRLSRVELRRTGKCLKSPN